MTDLKDVALEYARWVGVGVGLAILVYTVYALAGLAYSCECERINMASYLSAHMDRVCAAYAAGDYVDPTSEFPLYFNGTGRELP
jgi:hypothetical protein